VISYASKVKGGNTEDRWADTDGYAKGQQSDLISLLLFFKIRKMG
jgi:hypothetical protein